MLSGRGGEARAFGTQTHRHTEGERDTGTHADTDTKPHTNTHTNTCTISLLTPLATRIKQYAERGHAGAHLLFVSSGVGPSMLSGRGREARVFGMLSCATVRMRECGCVSGPVCAKVFETACTSCATVRVNACVSECDANACNSLPHARTHTRVGTKHTHTHIPTSWTGCTSRWSAGAFCCPSC